MSGQFRVEGRRGQFAKIEPGAGKLLGLLSLCIGLTAALALGFYALLNYFG